MTIHALQILPIPALKDNYIWAVVNRENQEAIMVDLGEAEPVKQFLLQSQCRLKAILLTHHHWDHTQGVEALKQAFACPVFGSIHEPIPTVTRPVQDQEKITIEGFPLTFTGIAIPGHTLGHMAFYAEGILFSGDTLFSAGCGRLFEGTAEQMYASLQKLAALPPTTKLYCGHEYTLKNLQFAERVEPGNQHIQTRIRQVTALREKNLPSLPSTLQEELQTNPFLRCQAPEVIASAAAHADKNLSDPVAVFAVLREWKNHY